MKDMELCKTLEKLIKKRYQRTYNELRKYAFRQSIYAIKFILKELGAQILNEKNYSDDEFYRYKITINYEGKKYSIWIDEETFYIPEVHPSE